jgi:hypothetical protein
VALISNIHFDVVGGGALLIGTFIDILNVTRATNVHCMVRLLVFLMTFRQQKRCTGNLDRKVDCSGKFEDFETHFRIK